MGLQYHIKDYREKLYSEIVQRRKDMRRRMREREGGSSRSRHHRTSGDSERAYRR